MKFVNSHKLTVPSVISFTPSPEINSKNMEEVKHQLTSIMVRDLIDVYLRNPYYKRPVLSFTVDKLVINFEKTFYAIENEISEVIRDWANTAVVISKAQLTPVKAREVELIEYYGEVIEHEILKSLLNTSKLTFRGNEVRKFSESELHEIINKALSSRGALFELKFTITVEKHPKEGLILGHYIFVPLSRELEFI